MGGGWAGRRREAGVGEGGATEAQIGEVGKEARRGVEGVGKGGMRSREGSMSKGRSKVRGRGVERGRGERF